MSIMIIAGPLIAQVKGLVLESQLINRNFLSSRSRQIVDGKEQLHWPGVDGCVQGTN
jgi:hypothetical protein